MRLKETKQSDSEIEKLLQNFIKTTKFDKTTAIEIASDYINYAETLLYEIEAGIKFESMDSVKVLLHQLKGTSSNMRVDNIYELVKKGEKVLQNSEISELMEILYEISEILDSLKKGFQFKYYRLLPIRYDKRKE